eukprot:SAG11_NODE_3140_length_2658_cov_3.387261_2_plen_58_part_00
MALLLTQVEESALHRADTSTRRVDTVLFSSPCSFLVEFIVVASSFVGRHCSVSICNA